MAEDLQHASETAHIKLLPALLCRGSVCSQPSLRPALPCHRRACTQSGRSWGGRHLRWRTSRQVRRGALLSCSSSTLPSTCLQCAAPTSPGVLALCLPTLPRPRRGVAGSLRGRVHVPQQAQRARPAVRAARHPAGVHIRAGRHGGPGGGHPPGAARWGSSLLLTGLFGWPPACQPACWQPFCIPLLCMGHAAQTVVARQPRPSPCLPKSYWQLWEWTYASLLPAASVTMHRIACPSLLPRPAAHRQPRCAGRRAAAPEGLRAGGGQRGEGQLHALRQPLLPAQRDVSRAARVGGWSTGGGDGWVVFCGDSGLTTLFLPLDCLAATALEPQRKRTMLPAPTAGLAIHYPLYLIAARCAPLAPLPPTGPRSLRCPGGRRS